MSDVYRTPKGYSQIFETVKVGFPRLMGSRGSHISDGADSIPKRRWAEEQSRLGLIQSEVLGLSIYT